MWKGSYPIIPTPKTHPTHNHSCSRLLHIHDNRWALYLQFVCVRISNTRKMYPTGKKSISSMILNTPNTELLNPIQQRVLFSMMISVWNHTNYHNIFVWRHDYSTPSQIGKIVRTVNIGFVCINHSKKPRISGIICKTILNA